MITSKRLTSCKKYLDSDSKLAMVDWELIYISDQAIGTILTSGRVVLDKPVENTNNPDTILEVIAEANGGSEFWSSHQDAHEGQMTDLIREESYTLEELEW